jgi:hypothetical protein
VAGAAVKMPQHAGSQGVSVVSRTAGLVLEVRRRPRAAVGPGVFVNARGHDGLAARWLVGPWALALRRGYGARAFLPAVAELPP